MERYRQDPDKLTVREIDRVVGNITDPSFEDTHINVQTIPFGIITIGFDGSVSTFSPELLGTQHPHYGSFSFGSVITDSFEEIFDNRRLKDISNEINNGVKNCESSCAYFKFCRGGAPSNKLAETGRFDSTTTLFCTLTQKIIIDVVLSALEKSIEYTEKQFKRLEIHTPCKS